MMTTLACILLQPCSSRYAATALGRNSSIFRTRHFSSTPAKPENKTALPQTSATESIELAAVCRTVVGAVAELYPQPVTYISESHDPWFNLSYEDWLLRNTPHDQPVLFLYRNQPCVVIGRNQNPWKETTPRHLRDISVPLIRRRSGGGTVYHDMGNSNFSIILPRLIFTRAHGAELVARAIRERLGIHGCDINDRNDVIIKDEKIGKDFKMSSAYKIIQHRAYHHGTMLISSSLSELGKSLKSSSPNIETKGIPSHPSPVTTLNTYLPSSRKQPIKHEDFVKAVEEEFRSVYSLGKGRMETKVVTEGNVKIAKVWDGFKELKSWEWQYGQTPEFSNSFEGVLSFGTIAVSLTSRHAVLTSLTFHLTPLPHAKYAERKEKQEFLDFLALALIGRRYETLDGAEGIGGLMGDGRYKEMGQEVIIWLRKNM